jgi:hypothetical protein
MADAGCSPNGSSSSSAVAADGPVQAVDSKLTIRLAGGVEVPAMAETDTRGVDLAVNPVIAGAGGRASVSLAFINSSIPFFLSTWLRPCTCFSLYYCRM